MTSKVITVTSIAQVGATFLDWSLHWLAGNDSVYSVGNNCWTKMSSTPLTANNAHQHCKNHTAGHGEYLHTLEQLLQTPTDSFHSCYPAPLDLYQTAQALSITESQLRDSKMLQWLKTTVDIDYSKIFTHHAQSPIIYIHTDPKHSMYQLLSLARAREDGYLGFHQWYFQDKMSAAHTAWDQREMLALDLQIDQPVDNSFIDFTVPHLWINCEDLWYHPQAVVQRCLDYIGVNADDSRWQQWQVICKSWLDIQRPILEFCRNIDHVVESIVKGWDYPLPAMSLLHEAIIQHRLIKDHNLNIRNWQLEHFPDNANKLHQLLEINQHSIRAASQLY